MTYSDYKFNNSEIRAYVDHNLKKESDQLEHKMTKTLEKMISDQTGDILSKKETASLLGVSTRTLSNWASEGILPRYRLGGKFYWKFFDVIDYMERDCADEPEIKFS